MSKVNNALVAATLRAIAGKSKPPKGHFGPNRDLSKCGRATDKEVMQ